MRNKIVAGNWKMNGDHESSLSLFNAISNSKVEFPNNVEVMVAPPFVYLSELVGKKDSAVTVVAQNCADKESGAYTGEVSANMLKSIGVKTAIVGHSERRHVYGESIRDISEKVIMLLKHDMRVIFCIGEQLSERKANTHFDVIEQQLSSILALDPSSYEKVIVAYEPVWAIGTGETASKEQAQEMHHFIRQQLADVYGNLAKQTPILYGGSVKPSNAAELFAEEDVDGGLVGGASLDADSFLGIIKAAG